MVAPKKKVSVNYEESRNKRMEENKKRMEDLKLTALSLSLKLTSTPNNKHPSSMKKVKRTPRNQVDLSTVRRSNRVAEKPPAIYKEEPIEMLGRRRSYGNKVRDLSNRVYASDEDREYASGRADELHSTLQPGFPSFVKPMLQSHVSGGFWLGLPVHFCKKHLAKRDEIMTLVDEDGDDWKAKYLPRKTGLSGGWKGFAEDHKLLDGDALVFQLIKPTVFKVYIIRVNQAEDSDDV